MFLPRPITEQEVESGKVIDLEFGAVSVQGWRFANEDSHLATVVDIGEEVAIVGVFDGHRGPEVADFAAASLPAAIKKQSRFLSDFSDVELVERGMKNAFKNLDEAMKTDESVNFMIDSGITRETKNLENLLELFEKDELVNLGACTRYVWPPWMSHEVSDEHDDAKDEGEEREDGAEGEEREDGAERVSAEEVLEKGQAKVGHREEKEGDAPGLGEEKIDSSLADSNGEGQRKRKGVESSQEELRGKDDVVGNMQPGNKKKKTAESSDVPAVTVVENGNALWDGRSSFLKGEGESPGPGCTSVVTLISKDYIACANAGDSRCVLSTDGASVELSEDHVPEKISERTRIEKAGGTVIDGRVVGDLNLTRSLGDLFYKKDNKRTAEEQLISGVPDVMVYKRCQNLDEFVILGCDGLWENVTSEDACTYVRKFWQAGRAPKEAASALARKSISPDPVASEFYGCDNVTVVVLYLSSPPKQN